VISALITLLFHGIVLLLLLFVVPLVQVNVFETEVLNVFIVPVDPLVFPNTAGFYEVPEDFGSKVPESEIPPDVPGGSGMKEGSLEDIDVRQEDPQISVQGESPQTLPLLSEFRLDKKAGARDDTDPGKSQLLILAPMESPKISPKKDDSVPDKVVDFNKYLQPAFPRPGSTAHRRRSGLGTSNINSQRAQANIKGAQFDVTPWASVVVERIQKNWIIPSDRENPAKARVGIDVKISKKGDLVEIEVVESSLIQSFDQAALAAIKESAPFPSIPEEYPGIVLQIYFIFQYND
jgi:TonB family protein